MRDRLPGRRVPYAFCRPKTMWSTEKLGLGMFQLLGYQVDAVENGREAVAASARLAYDMLLMDCQMPEKWNFAATKAIRDGERHRGGHVPIVALTAHTTDSVATMLGRRHD